MKNETSDYQYHSAKPAWDNGYLWQPVEKLITELASKDQRIFELGCGNGTGANELTQQGFNVVAIDSSESGIAIAKNNFPETHFHLGSAYDDLASMHGHFPIVLSLEVVEHLYWPKKYANAVFDLLEPGGTAIISTPYHGYLKNLVIALSGKFDDHVHPLNDGGHIKFWSKKTLHKLLMTAGFESVEFVMAGRVPLLAKSMIAIAKKKR